MTIRKCARIGLSKNVAQFSQSANDCELRPLHQRGLVRSLAATGEPLSAAPTSLVFSIFLLLIIAGSTGITGCANIVPPMGGPRDSLPPVLVSVVPADSTRGFKQLTGSKIVFTFNEYVEVKEIHDNLIMSPVAKTDPIIDYKLRTMTVRIRDTLQPNTTYAMDFGKAIRDVNEGNILKNFTYVFSTGKAIDSSEYTGTVIVAQTGKPDSSLIVILHDKLDDSAVVKERPRYMARVDTTGRFHFRFLHPGTYALYAMKDEGGTHRYMSKGQLFAFADSPVVITNTAPPVTLYAYTEKYETKPASKTGTTGGGAGKSPTTKPSEKEKEKDKRLQLQTNLSGGEFDVLDTFRLTFSHPLTVFDSTKIRFTDDNFTDIDTANYKFRRDTTGKIVFMYYNWPTDTKFHLIAAKDFASDSAGRKLPKNDTISFHTKKDIDYGEVSVRIRNLDLTRNPVLQFVQSDAVKYAYPFGNSNLFRRILFPPGEYELRILYDENKNGLWDPGEFFEKHRQPEKVTTLRKKLNVKANWDNDTDVTL